MPGFCASSIKSSSGTWIIFKERRIQVRRYYYIVQTNCIEQVTAAVATAATTTAVTTTATEGARIIAIPKVAPPTNRIHPSAGFRTVIKNDSYRNNQNSTP